MATVVYIDVLFVINFSVNYFLLHITQKILSIKTSKLKKVIAASLGGVYSCLIFFPELSGLYTFYSKVIFSLIITFIAFPADKVRFFVKTVAVFYTASFLLCGVTFALMIITRGFGYKVGETNNGIFYFNFNWKVLLWGAGICFVTVKIINAVLSSVKGTIYKEVKINFMKNSVTLQGMVDTGNRLSDPANGEPVIVCEMSAVESIIPDGMKDFFDKSTDELSINYLNSLWGVRLIPYDSIGKAGGIIKGFVSDSVEVDGKTYSKITVAIHNGHFSCDMNYKALLGARFL